MVSGEEMMKLAGHVWSKYFKGERESRDELVAEGVLAMVKASGSYKADNGVKETTYLCVCARMAMAMWLRKQRKNWRGVVGADVVDFVGDRVSDDGEDMYEMLARADVVDKVREANGVMRPKANAIANALLNGERKVDVARKFGVSKQNVSNMFIKLKKRTLEKYDYVNGVLVDKVVIRSEEKC